MPARHGPNVILSDTRWIFIPFFGSGGFTLRNISLISSPSHLDDGGIDQRLEADEARVPIVSGSAVYRAGETVGWMQTSTKTNFIF